MILTLDDITIKEVKDLPLQDLAARFRFPYDRTTRVTFIGEEFSLVVSYTHNKLLEGISTIGVYSTNTIGAGESEAANREAVCRSCPAKVFDSTTVACRKCGCYLTNKWKIKDSTCPLNFWK
jgi:hypothetical protein